MPYPYVFRGRQRIKRNKRPKRNLMQRPIYIDVVAGDLCNSDMQSAHRLLYSKKLMFCPLAVFNFMHQMRCSNIL